MWARLLQLNSSQTLLHLVHGHPRSLTPGYQPSASTSVEEEIDILSAWLSKITLFSIYICWRRNRLHLPSSNYCHSNNLQATSPSSAIVGHFTFLNENFIAVCDQSYWWCNWPQFEIGLLLIASHHPFQHQVHSNTKFYSMLRSCQSSIYHT